MSSLRVRAQNKLLVALGAAKPSANVAFDLALADFEATYAGLQGLNAAVHDFAASLARVHTAAGMLLGAVDGVAFSAAAGSATGERARPQGASDMQRFAAETRAACADVDILVQRETSGRLEQEVVLPLRGWLQRARALHRQVASFQGHKEIFDHYTRKVLALREAQDKRSNSGRGEKPRDAERLARNEQKLAATTREYMKLSDVTIQAMRAFVGARDATLAPLLQRLLRIRVMYATRMYEASARMRVLAEEGGSRDDDGGALDELVELAKASELSNSSTSATTPTKADAATVRSNSPLPPPLGVRRSSFEEFVGEMPPSMPTSTSVESALESAPKAAPALKNDGDVSASWMSFDSPPSPQETSPASPTRGVSYGFSEPHCTPPLSVPQPRSMATTTGASNPWGDFAMTSSPWDESPAASAPPSDPFSSADWTTATDDNAQSQQEMAFPGADFRDLHLNALGSGDSNPYR